MAACRHRVVVLLLVAVVVVDLVVVRGNSRTCSDVPNNREEFSRRGCRGKRRVSHRSRRREDRDVRMLLDDLEPREGESEPVAKRQRSLPQADDGRVETYQRKHERTSSRPHSRTLSLDVFIIARARRCRRASVVARPRRTRFAKRRRDR